MSEVLCTALYDSLEAGRLLRQYTCLIPMLYCDAITDAMIKGLGQQKISVRYNILTNILDVIFLYLLLPGYGIEGYFFSFVVTHLLNFILSYRRLLKITFLKIPWYIPAFAISCGIFSVWVCSHLKPLNIRILLYPVVLVAGWMTIGILGGEDLRWMLSLIRKKPQTQ